MNDLYQDEKKVFLFGSHKINANLKMKLYKFRPLLTEGNRKRIISIIQDGFYCCDFLNYNDVNEGVYPDSQNKAGVDLVQKLEYKICSFSAEAALGSQLMWGHYAAAGMGVAIEIDVAVASGGPIKKVEYGKDGRYDNVEEILTNKSKDWEYEAEWRYLSTEPDKFYEAIVTKIYFGTPYRCLNNYQEIKSKHRTLSKYLRYSKKLKRECDTSGIVWRDYDFCLTL